MLAEGMPAEGLPPQVQWDCSILGLLQTASPGAGLVQLEEVGGCGLQALGLFLGSCSTLMSLQLQPPKDSLRLPPVVAPWP